MIRTRRAALARSTQRFSEKILLKREARWRFKSGFVALYLVVPPASPHHMRAVLDIVIIVLDLYVWLLIASAILSWLVAFNVVNTRKQFVSAVAEFLYRITEPVLRPIRNVMPNLGGLDISPIIVILIIMFIQRVIAYYIYPNVI